MENNTHNQIHNHLRRLYRSRTNKVFAGVLGGLGEYFNIDPVVFRLLFVFGAFFSGIVPGIIAYVISIFIVPKKPINHN